LIQPAETVLVDSTLSTQKRMVELDRISMFQTATKTSLEFQMIAVFKKQASAEARTLRQTATNFTKFHIF
jgi:hypothetical protein